MKKRIAFIAIGYYVVTMLAFILFPNLVKNYFFLAIWLIVSISLIIMLYSAKKEN